VVAGAPDAKITPMTKIEEVQEALLGLIKNVADRIGSREDLSVADLETVIACYEKVTAPPAAAAEIVQVIPETSTQDPHWGG
jgi:hypothetical protein